jgi:hypothetical protein
MARKPLAAKGLSDSSKQIEMMLDEVTLKSIVSGETKEVFRNLSYYNIQLLTKGPEGEFDYEPREDIGKIRFYCGFDKAMFCLCEINGIFLDEFVKFVPKGMKPDTVALTIKIEQIIDHNLRIKSVC